MTKTKLKSKIVENWRALVDRLRGFSARNSRHFVFVWKSNLNIYDTNHILDPLHKYKRKAAKNQASRFDKFFSYANWIFGKSADVSAKLDSSWADQQFGGALQVILSIINGIKSQWEPDGFNSIRKISESDKWRIFANQTKTGKDFVIKFCPSLKKIREIILLCKRVLI